MKSRKILFCPRSQQAGWLLANLQCKAEIAFSSACQQVQTLSMLQKAKAKCKSSGGTLCQCRSTQNYTDPATAPENLLSRLRLGFIFLFLSFFAHDNLKRNPGGTRKPFKVRMKSATGKIGVRLPLSTACIDQAAARGDPREPGGRGGSW